MLRGATGEWAVTRTGDEVVRAFVPRALPPVPPLERKDATWAGTLLRKRTRRAKS